MSDPKPKNIAEKLVAAISEVDRIGKDGTNQHFNYTYTSAEQVYRVVRGPLLAQGLVVVPSVDHSTTVGEGKEKTTTTRLHLQILDAGSGEKIDAYWMGEGQDQGDKGPYKAATGGMKTWLKHLFMLPADDDPEADPATDTPPQPTLKERLSAASEKLDVPPGTRKDIAGWFLPDGVLDRDRLVKAVDRLENGDLDGLLKSIDAERTAP